MRKAVLFVLLLTAIPCLAIKESKLSLLRRIHTYAMTLDTSNVAMVSYTYGRATVRVDNRNPILMLVPSAYVISRGKEREFTSEVYNVMTVKGYNNFETEPLLRLTTIPHRRRTMENFGRYVTPNIYDETIVHNTLLSPFHPVNFRFYSYHVGLVRGDTVELRFRPKRHNTQLIRGSAVVDRLTGRILRCDYSGEYDMVRILMSMEMGEHGFASLFPKKCEALLWFGFLGNKVTAHYTAHYNLPQVLTDSIDRPNNPYLMAKVRPDTLPELEQEIYRRKLTRDVEAEMRAATDSAHKKGRWVKDVLWDVVGDNMLNRIKTNFGQNGQGYIRVNPVMNPLYMSYSSRKGFTYKFDLHMSYQLTGNSEIFGRIRGGYAFKLRQFYFRLPIFYYFDRRNNRYLKFEVGNGNRIQSHTISQQMTLSLPLAGGQNLVDPSVFNEFKQGDCRLIANYDFSDKFGVQAGVLYQRWKPANPFAFRMFGWDTMYSSFAPVLQLQYRPLGWSGPILTADYDRGIKGVLKSNTRYERYEVNSEYIHRINKLQALQMRLGAGLYTNKGRNAYFLNYENFKENNIPGGWNDDWSGEFELLRDYTYNTSSYYVRWNLTYESPLLLLSWLPWVGHYMEMERLYVSCLDVERIHPYFEVGYGFTTRLLSMGIFVSNGRGNRTFGCKFGFELFRHW